MVRMKLEDGLFPILVSFQDTYDRFVDNYDDIT